jgi:hypothetical protein
MQDREKCRTVKNGEGTELHMPRCTNTVICTGRTQMRQFVRQRLSVASIILIAAWLVVDAVPRAYAQNQSQAPSPAPSQRSPDLSDQKLEAAAAALQRVVRVRADYQQRIEAAPPSDSDKIADEAKGALVKAITDQGLSIDEYVSILVVAENDPAVRDKIVARMQEPK